MSTVEATSYPIELLVDCESVLLLFGCAFAGRNDGQYVRAAGKLDVTVVDSDPVALDAMRDQYPAEWEWWTTDAFAFVRHAKRRWDLVGADLPSSMPLEMVTALPLWCSVADRYVVATVTRFNFEDEVDAEAISAPRGWKAHSLVQRSEYRGGCWWLVLERR